MIVDRITRDRRRAICSECPHMRKYFKILFIKIPKKPQCKLCKCLIKSKTMLSFVKCPINKW